MRRTTKRILALLMTLFMCLAPFAPLVPTTAILAEESQPQAAIGETISSINFDDKKVNTSGSQVAQYGGMMFQPGSGGEYSVNDGYLDITSGSSGDPYVLFALNFAGHNNDSSAPINRDFWLSFDIRMDADNQSPGHLIANNYASAQNNSFTLANLKENGLYISNTKIASFETGVWSTVETVFNYNGDVGRFTSYTLLVDGQELYTAAISLETLDFINQLWLFRWGTAGAQFSLDNFLIAYGKGNRGSDTGTTLYNVDFSESEFEGRAPIGNDHTVHGMRILNVDTYDTELTGIRDGVLSMVCKSGQTFLDAHLSMGEFKKQDLTVTMYVKPIKLGEAFFSLSDGNNGIVKGSDTSISIGGKSKALSTSAFSCVEVVLPYDYATMCYSSARLFVNGEYIGATTLPKSLAAITFIRLAQVYSAGYGIELDSFTVTSGCTPLYKDVGTTLYNVDFSESEFEGKAPIGNDHIVHGMRILNVDTYDTEQTGIRDGVLSMVSKSGQTFLDAHISMGEFQKQDLTVTMYVKPIKLADAFFSLSDGNNGIVKGNGHTISINGITKNLSPYRFSCVEVVLPFDYATMTYTSAKLYVNGDYIGATTLQKSLSAVTFIRLAQSYSAGCGFELDSFTVTSGVTPLHKDGEPTVTDFVGYQTSIVDYETGLYNVRLVAVMTDADLSKYQNVGFKLTLSFASGVTVEMPFENGVCTSVYESIISSPGIRETYTAEMLGGKAIFALNCLNLSTDNGAVTFTGTTYYTPKGAETEVEETSFNFTIEKKAEPQDIDIYLIGGQSNASGSSRHHGMLDGVFQNVGYAGQTEKSYVTGVASNDFLFSYSKYKWEVTAGLGILPTIGPEYGMAEIFNDYYTGETKAFIFKSAAGGTALVTKSTDAYGTWLPRSMWEEGYDPENTTTGIGYQYHTFVKNFEDVYWTLKENGYNPIIKGMAWMQGEADLSNPQLYGEALTVMINDLRADLYAITGDENVKEMPFVIGKIATSFGSYDNPRVPVFNEVQQSVADNIKNCETIETADLIIVGADGSILGNDKYHFNYSDSRTLGNRFAQKLMELNGMTQ